MDDIIEDLLEWQELETESESLQEFLQAESKKPEEFQIQNLDSKFRFKKAEEFWHIVIKQQKVFYG